MRALSRAFKKWSYYATSVANLLQAARDPFSVVRLLGRIGGAESTVELRSGERFIIRSPMDLWMIKESVLDRQYEHPRAPLEDGFTVIDVGAGLGDFAISVARRFPASKVLAVEPFPPSRELLQRNIQLNSAKNVTVWPGALAGAQGTATMDLRGGEPTFHTTVELPPSLCRDDHSVSAIMVQITTLDELVSGAGFERVDLLKMDCEGAEFEVLFSTRSYTLSRVGRICVEYHDGWTEYHHLDLTEYLICEGFEVEVYPNPVRSDIGLIHAIREE
jgi:FkbM family methyltransferase